MRGYGDSDKPAGSYDGQTLVADFRALAKHLHLGPLHIVAHDMGAPPALLWAAEHPKEIASLTYLEEPVLTSETLAPVFQFSRRLRRTVVYGGGCSRSRRTPLTG